MNKIYKYYPPKTVIYGLRQEIQEIIKKQKLSGILLSDFIFPTQYIIGSAVIKDKSFPNNKQKLIIHQTKLKDKNDQYVLDRIHRNVLIPTLPTKLILESDKKAVPSTWYYVVNINGEIDVLQSFNPIGFLAKHYLLENDVPILYGGEIAVYRKGNTKIIKYNHLSGNYSKFQLDQHLRSESKRNFETTLTKLSKKIFELQINFFKDKLWKSKEPWMQDIVLEYSSKRAFEVFGLPSRIEIDYWCQKYKKRILISEASQATPLWKATKLLDKHTNKKLKPEDLEKKLQIGKLSYFC